MKTLIAYTTKHGCAAKVAELLQSKLSGEIRIVNLRKDTVSNLEEFDRIILGGSVYIGKVQPQLQQFLTKYHSVLIKKPFGLYLCAGENDPEARQKLLETVFPELLSYAVAKEVVGGEYNIATLNFIEKMAIRMVTGKLENSSTLSEAAVERIAKAMTD